MRRVPTDLSTTAVSGGGRAVTGTSSLAIIAGE